MRSETRDAYLDAARVVDDLILGYGESSEAGRALAEARRAILEKVRMQEPSADQEKNR
jgi:hypothetical protein